MATDVEKFTGFCESEFGKKVLVREAEYLRRELEGCQQILDIGCGIGQFEQQLQALNITGLDISEEMIREARKRNNNLSNKTFVLGNAERLDFGDSCFDAVFFVAALEFIVDYQMAIQEAYRVTKPCGKLIVMMLNPYSGYFHEHMQQKDSYFRKVKHRNLGEIRECIARHYRIIKDEYFLGIKGQQVFDTSDKRAASLYVVAGIKEL
ncbi:methyltransferase domain-containing protein [Candidatus Woesearchaeota archaeon]|nr:methyltransferase domain-containing protein [Candidatus Woesearchaeota archaeon]